MEEQEAPLEDVHERIHEHAEHARERWVSAVALSTAVLAALAAIASLVSGDNVNEAMIDQIQAADRWGQYQATGIKSLELGTRIALLEDRNKPVDPRDRSKLAEYQVHRDEIRDQAKEKEQESDRHMQRHKTVSLSVTFSQLAIAVSAISILTRQKWFWGLSLLLGSAGLVLLIWGLWR